MRTCNAMIPTNSADHPEVRCGHPLNDEDYCRMGHYGPDHPLPSTNKVLDARIMELVEDGMKQLGYTKEGMEPPVPDDPARPHIVKGEFQSDKYPKTPRGKVPLSVKDPLAQDLLWEYAQRRRQVDSDFSNDLEFALRKEGFSPQAPTFRWIVDDGHGDRRQMELVVRYWVRRYGEESELVTRPFELADMLKVGWYTAPPWLADVAEALGQKGLSLNWTQMLQEIRKLKESRDEWQENAAMACESPDPDCTCSGCSYAREKNTG